MPTLGSVVLKLEAQFADLKAGLEQSNKHMDQTSEKAESMRDRLTAAFAAIGIGFAVAKLTEWTKSAFEAASATYHTSAALGIASDKLEALHLAAKKAGLSGEEIDGAMRKMLKSLADAREAGTPAAEAFAELGIKSDELKGKKPDEVFRVIAEKVGQVKDPLARARAEVELFGKEGIKLNEMLVNGGEALDEAAARAAKYGNALSEVDEGKLVAANEKIDEAADALEGMGKQIAVAVAPFVQELAEDLLNILPAADKMQSFLGGALRLVGKGVAIAIDAFTLMKSGVLAVGAVAAAAFSDMFYALGKVADAIIWVVDKVSGTKIERPAWIGDAEKFAAEAKAGLSKDAFSEFAKVGSAQEKVDSFFEHIQTKSADAAKHLADKKNSLAEPIVGEFGEARKKIDEILKGMQAQVDGFGLTDADKKVKELQALGAKGADIAKANDLARQLDALEQWKKDQEEAKKIVEESIDPVERYQEQIQKLEDLQEKGLLDDKSFASAVGKANDELRNSLKDATADKKTGAETRRLDFRGPANAPERVDPLQAIQQNGKKQTDILDQMRVWMRDIWRFQQNADTNANEVATIPFV